ncbi:MAG: HAD family hydrolase [Phenylobacterium sp.]|uniref:HAD family hydrolase n=1 Tax=Phenylobacterium sp. TaxID=1871053 RepID=UPI0039193E61
MTPALVLATDLDGTFLGGLDAARQALYAGLSAREDVLLIFVTGRDLDFVARLIETPGMPRPHYIVGDIGTSVFDGRTLQPVADLEAPIAAAWNDAGERVKAMLVGEPGLTLQDTPFRHRVSYDYDPARLSPRSVAKVEAAGFDCLLSADRFFDVLPRGVSKGPTLIRLVEALGLDPEGVLVAGDTMNDLSLFQTGFKGVAVGNSEPRLLRAVERLRNVHVSRLPGAAGIADAIRHFKFKGAPNHEQVVAGHRLSPAAQ